jgi:MoaA/NifB/PqqE/SkfB family radical SAM enzyme
MSNTFCALPFQHLCIGYEGTARVCCVTSHLVTEHGAPMSLNTHTMDEIWNSAYMRNIRRGMLKGERISACEVCYQREAASGQSYRTTVGSEPIQGRPTTRANVDKYGAAGFRVETRPDFLKLEIGNLCNLKCRMCYGANSSQIERDPVHGKWSGGVDPLHAVWRGDTARIGPEPRIGVRTSGLYSPEMLAGALRCWTDGQAIFSVPLRRGTRITSLDISFHSAGIRDQHFQVIINGRPMANGILQSAESAIAIDLSRVDTAAELTIEILSNKIVEAAGEPERGLPLSGLVLRRELAPSSNTLHPQLLSSRLDFEGPWYMDGHKIFDDVLKSADTLRRLCITGGEPFINHRVAEIFDFLIDRGAAQRIHLELVTNCTHIDARIIERLKKFQRVQLFVSFDGIRETYEYIRYPARWNMVEANLRDLRDRYGMSCQIETVVQIYNVLRLVELYRFCDAMGISVTMHMLREPNWLAIYNLPPKTRKAAAAKLFEYHDTDCRAADKPAVLSLARYLDQLSTPANPGVIREFMLFTNDLDATRGQSIRRTHPELVQLLAEDGFEWVDDTLHATGNSRNKPARERVYAWL